MFIEMFIIYSDFLSLKLYYTKFSALRISFRWEFFIVIMKKMSNLKVFIFPR